MAKAAVAERAAELLREVNEQQRDLPWPQQALKDPPIATRQKTGLYIEQRVAKQLCERLHRPPSSVPVPATNPSDRRPEKANSKDLWRDFLWVGDGLMAIGVKLLIGAE